MQITSIVGRNINGNTFAHSGLPQCVVFTGQNGSGKSTRLAAIMLALFGYHPLMPRTNAAIMDMADGSIMEVGVALSNGDAVCREWTERRGSASCKVKSSLPEGSPITPMAFDHREFFGLSGPEQMRTLFRLTRSERNFGSELVAKAKVIKLKEHDAAAEEVVAKIVREVIQLAENDKQLPWPEWLDTFALVAKKRCSDATAAAERMASTLEGLAELRAQAKSVVDSSAERELAALNRAIVDSNSRLQQLLEQAKAASAAEARIATIESTVGSTAGISEARAEVAALEQQSHPTVSVASELARQLAAIVERERSLTAEVDRHGSLIEQADELALAVAQAADAARLLPEQIAEQRAIVELGAAAERYQSESAILQAEVESWTRNSSNYSASVRLLQASAQAFDQKLSELAALSACPFCEAESEGWRANVQSKIEAQRAETTALLAQSQNALAAADKGLEQASARLKQSREQDLQMAEQRLAKASAQAVLERLLSELEDAQAVVERGAGKSVTELRLEQAGLIEQLESVAAEREQLEARLQAAESAAEAQRHQLKLLSDARARLDNLIEQERQYDSLRGELDVLRRVPSVDPSAIEQARAELDGLKQRVEPLTVATRRASASKGEAATRLQAAEAALRVTKEAECWKQVRGLVDDLKEEAVKDGVGPVVASANVIASRLLPTPLAFHEGRIGRMGPKRFIPITAFCDSDQLIAYSSVAVALAQASNCPAKVVLMDRMESIEPKRKRLLVEAVADAIRSGAIGQFIGADVRASDYVGLEGVSVIAVA